MCVWHQLQPHRSNNPNIINVITVTDLPKHATAHTKEPLASSSRDRVHATTTKRMAPEMIERKTKTRILKQNTLLEEECNFTPDVCYLTPV